MHNVDRCAYSSVSPANRWEMMINDIISAHLWVTINLWWILKADKVVEAPSRAVAFCSLIIDWIHFERSSAVGGGPQFHESRRAWEGGYDFWPADWILSASSFSSFWHGPQLQPLTGPHMPSQQRHVSTFIPQ